MNNFHLSPKFIPLQFALVRYQKALEYLDRSNTPLSTEQALEILSARDALQNVLKTQEQVPVELLLQVMELDSNLKQKAHRITQVFNLAKFRESFPIYAQDWWWNLDTIESLHPWCQFDWLFKGLRVAVWTGNITLLVDIITRFASGVAGIAGAFAVVAPSLLTLLMARNELTEAGQKGFEKLIDYWKIPVYLREVAKLGSTLLLSGVLIIFWASAPKIFNFYGMHKYSQGNIGTAEKNFLRAIALNADYWDAHYNLGNLYEDTNNIDKAFNHYQIAVRGQIPEAYNNLARLLIQKKEYPQAVALLNQGLLQAGKQNSFPEVKYNLFKNLGWARFEQGRDTEAQQALQTATGIASNPEVAKYLKNRGSAHCLLAQVLQRQKKPSAIQQWQQCCQLGSTLNPDEDTWLHLAQKKLQEAGKSCK